MMNTNVAVKCHKFLKLVLFIVLAFNSDRAFAVDDGSLIDVMVVYTAEARNSTVDIASEIQLAIDSTNEGFANSNISTRVRLVHTAEVAYTESKSTETDLDRLRVPNDGYMDEVHSLRDQYDADLVSLFVNNFIDGFGGIAYIYGGRDYGFSVNASPWDWAFPHEIGHNLGAGHDRATPGAGLYDYSYGYYDVPQRFGTIMSYNGTRIPHFSNPLVSYNATPTGIPEGDPAAADNAKTINNSALAVSNYEQTTGPSWMNVGLGGRVIYTLAIDPVTPSTIYAGTEGGLSGGGLFRTLDSGESWHAINYGLTDPAFGLTPNVFSFAIDPVTPGTLYAGTGAYGGFKSTDGGSSWNVLHRYLTDKSVIALAMDPITPTTLYIATSTFTDEMLKMEDGLLSFLYTSRTANTFAIDPVTLGTFYAGVKTGGIYKGTNGGSSWVYLPNNLIVYALAIDPVTPSTIYAGTDGGGVFKSTDSGINWTAVNSGLTKGHIYALAIDPVTPTTLYAGALSVTASGGGLFKSTDGGANWTEETGLAFPSVRTLAIDPTNPSILYVGTNGGGVFRYGIDAADAQPPFTSASPAGGEFISSQLVSLSCSDNSSGCATTYYTIDGSTPSTGSPAYSGPIAVSANTTLKFFSVDNAGNIEGINSESYSLPFPAGGMIPVGWVQSSGSDLGWVVDYANASVGAYSLRSGPITHNQASAIEVTTTTGVGNISFDFKTDSESNYDKLFFYIDGIEQTAGAWSGTIPWTSASFSVSTAGVHTFKWAYDKDGSVNSGADAAWIDNVVFPPAEVSADLAITKIDSADPILQGQSVTYTITATNNGPSDATNVVVTDTLPVGVTFNSAATTLGSCGELSGTVTCDIGTLTNGASANVTIVVTAPTPGLISNTATVSGNVTDSIPANNSATQDTTVLADSDGDGLSDIDEGTLGTNPNNPDSDGDGLNDWEEVNLGTDGYVTNPLSNDSDGDGLSDDLEAVFGSNPNARDSDGGGASDFVEYHRNPQTDPWNPADDLLGGDFWSSIGLEGGIVNAFAIDPIIPSMLYAGTVNGVFKSTNGGLSWAAVNAGLTNTNILALAIDSVTPSTLYAGSNGGGVFKSTDGGLNWVAVSAGQIYPYVNVVTIDPVTPFTLYAGTAVGVFKSTDGGLSWGVANAGLTNLDVRALAIDPTTPSTVYAGTYGGGVFKSTNGGLNWVATSLFYPYVRALAIDYFSPFTLYSGTPVGVFRSVDGGTNWMLSNTGLANTNVYTFAIEPTMTSRLYVGTYGGGVFKSANGGASWVAMNAGLADLNVSAFAIDPVTPFTRYAGTWSGGAFRTGIPPRAANDFDGNGRSDILWRNAASGLNYLYVMNSNVIASEGVINVVSDPNWQIVGTGDYDGNHTADILWRNGVTGENRIYFMNGNTIVSQGAILTVGDTNWHAAGSGDYNGDGKSDILWRHAVTGQNHIWFMNGLAIASQGTVNFVPTNWQVMGSGDLDGDGKSDILWRNSNNGRNHAYLMNGNLIASQGTINTVPLNWVVAGTGDYDGDGRADILWRNSLNGRNHMYLLNGFTIASQGTVNTVPLNWDIVGDGDYDGDGKADILWRNMSNGRNFMYFMNGNVIAGSGVVNTVSNFDWVVTNPR